jgi:Ca2+-transporting ATPase
MTPESPDSVLVEIVHDAVPGRLRCRVRGLHRNRAAAAALEEALEGSGVRDVRASALTGTVLIVFELGLERDHLVGRLAQAAGALPQAAPDTGIDWLDGARPFRRGWRAERPAVRAVLRVENEADGWHVRQAADVLTLVGTTSRGLAAGEAAARLARDGPNVVPERGPRSVASMVADQLRNGPVLLLLGTTLLSVASGGFADAAIIAVVVTLNAGIGVYTQRRAERAISGLTRTRLPEATVIRDGRHAVIEAETLVAGDLLLLGRGTYVAADARLLQSDHLSVDESALTGESVPVEKSPGSLLRRDLPLADRTNMVYRGTVVTGGGGLAVVVAIGEGTEMGRIQALIQLEEQPLTPLQRQLDGLGNQLARVGVAVSAAVLAVALLRRLPFLEALRTTIALAVASIPEGLPTVATVTLATAVRDMRRRGLVARRLDAIETMGGIQVLCLDKTGTITTNRMAVVAVETAGRRLALTEAGFRDQQSRSEPPDSDTLRRLLEVASLCSEAELIDHEGTVQLSGSATETAILDAAIRAGIDLRALRGNAPLLVTEQRAETRQFMATRHEIGAGTQLVAVKGRPDQVMARCTSWASPCGIVPLSDADREQIAAANEALAGQAYRVLGVAEGRVAPEAPHWNHDLVWRGLIAIADPVRPGMADLIRRLRQAGIRTVMITGDQSATATAIARELDLAGGEELQIVDSIRLEALAPAVLASLASRVHVFSRVNPSHKLRIVRALQAAGQVVAMTGDGINDGPALKGADVGIALGRDGASVAREVADIVLTDDNLTALLSAVARGRNIRDDLEKSVHFITVTNLSEVLFMFGGVATGFGVPLNAKQLLWINLITDVFPELALALEPPERDVLARPPGDPTRPLVPRAAYPRLAGEATVLTGAGLASYLYGVARYGRGPRAAALGFNALTAAQLLHAISVRSEHHSMFRRDHLPENRWVSLALGGGFGVQLVGQAVAGLRGALGTARLSIMDLGVALTAALASFVANETLKEVRLRTAPALLPAAQSPGGTP